MGDKPISTGMLIVVSPVAAISRLLPSMIVNGPAFECPHKIGVSQVAGGPLGSILSFIFYSTEVLRAATFISSFRSPSSMKV
jgi:hypothetical protein